MSLPPDWSHLLDFLAVLNSQLRLDRLMTTVIDISLAVTGAERAFLMLFDKNEELSIKVARNSKKEDLSESEFQTSTSIIGTALREKRSLYFPRISESGDLASSDSVRRMKLKSAICIPLWCYPRDSEEIKKLIGVLYMDSSLSGNPLQEEHLRLMEALTNHVAISLENARLFEEVEDQRKKISELNDQLQKRVEIQAGNITEMKILLAETQRELGKVYGLGNIIGKSQPMLKVYKMLEKIVPTNATVLILGKSGTGKELIAKYIHYNGRRSDKPMVSVNCSAFSDPLLESELFGHRKGAFTGATENKMGLFQLADGGTLFLDEVGDMSADMQKKLLRVLQDGEVRPVGSREIYRGDVRIIAATNKDLKKLVQDGQFREDLYFRLSVIILDLPPLKERREDIPLLIDFFTHKISTELGQPLKKIPDSIFQKFMEYDWPGNVRELENELRRVHILESEYQPEQFQAVSVDDDISMASAEKQAILKALGAANGNKRRAAEILGIPRSSFYQKLAKHKIF
ncbi:MAG TPA: sigma-54-dependent Fis family transcriptional regulator [Acidobacteriota bacterium]|nr:sigma-54-dependent Fis family transcriptional regulator [Acidobacteriota bacterium]